MPSVTHQLKTSLKKIMKEESFTKNFNCLVTLIKSQNKICKDKVRMSSEKAKEFLLINRKDFKGVKRNAK